MSSKRPLRISFCQCMFWVKVLLALSIGITGMGYQILLVLQFRNTALNPVFPVVPSPSPAEVVVVPTSPQESVEPTVSGLAPRLVVGLWDELSMQVMDIVPEKEEVLRKRSGSPRFIMG